VILKIKLSVSVVKATALKQQISNSTHQSEQ